MKIIQTYLYNNDRGQKSYFVSTMYRRSSAVEGPSHYFETIAFRMSKDELGEIVGGPACADSQSAAVQIHAELCAPLSHPFDREALKAATP